MSSTQQTTDNHGAEDERCRRDELIAHYITRHPDKPGRAEALVADYWIPVWALIGYLPAVDGDIQQVADDYELPLEAVEAAVAYYECHREVIDDRIEANEYRSA
jgi:uncharacterized protein (DUF433 family)